MVSSKKPYYTLTHHRNQMRVTYPTLNQIIKTENDHRYIISNYKREAHNKPRLVKAYYNEMELIDLYNKKADLKRYETRTTVDIFI